MNEQEQEQDVLTPEARAKLAEFGRKGGAAGSKEAKSAAGKKGWRAMIRKVTQAQPAPEAAPEQPSTQQTDQP